MQQMNEEEMHLADSSGVDPSRVGAFFDVDETLVRGASVFWAAREMFSHGFFGLRDLQYAARQTLRYVLLGENQQKMGEYGDRAASLMEGNSVEQLQHLAEGLFDRYFVPNVYRATYDRLMAHRAQGHQVWLISATPWLIAEVFARRLGAAGGVGTRMQVSGGRILGKLEGNLVHGPGKVTILHEVSSQNGIDLQQSWAYSDSANDIPLLSAVGHPVAVNPDSKLAEHARRSGWEILQARERKDILRRSAIKYGMAVGVGAAGYWILQSAAKRVGRTARSLLDRN